MAHNDNVIPFPGRRNWEPPIAVPPEPFVAPDSATLLTLLIGLDGTEPPVWRRLEIRGEVTLDLLHEVIQPTMGWFNSHLHQFRMSGGDTKYAVEPFVTAYAESEGDEGIRESSVRLDQVLRDKGDHLFYEYDFGDGWDHTLTLEATRLSGEGDPSARCLSGERACPPEDIGGIYTFNEVVAFLADSSIVPQDPSHLSQVIEWLPVGYDPTRFNPAEVNEALVAQATVRAALDATIHPVLRGVADRLTPASQPLFADLITAAQLNGPDPTPSEIDAAMVGLLALLEVCGGAGAELTGAGYLRPAIVARLVETLGIDLRGFSKGNREEHVPPVAHLRDTAQALGLVRRFKGRLVPTPAGRLVAGNGVALWGHIADRLPLGKTKVEQEAGALALLVAASDHTPRSDFRQIAVRLLSDAGWRLGDGSEMDSWTAYDCARPTWMLIDAMEPSQLWRLDDRGSQHQVLLRQVLRRDGVAHS